MLSVLGEAALRTALLAAVVQCSLWLLRVRQAQLLLATWTIVLAASVAMPMLPSFTPVPVPVDPTLPMSLIDGAADLLQWPSPQALPGGAFVEARAGPPSLGPWLEAAYLVGASTLVLRLLLGVGLSFRLLAKAVPVRPEWAAGARVRISWDIQGPVTIAHVILLPVDAVNWSPATRQAVLAHEGAHVARWDFAMLIVSQLNRALFWFSPLSWWLHHRLVALTELASDDQAMAATHDRLGYAEILLEMGRRSGPSSRGPAMARPSTLPHRIDRILLDQQIPGHVSRPRQVSLTLGVAGLSLAIANLAPDPVARPASALIAQDRNQRNGSATGPTPDDADAVGQNTPAWQRPVQEGSPGAALPSLSTGTPAGLQSHPGSASPSPVPPPATAVQRSGGATQPIPRSPPQAPTRNRPIVSPPRAIRPTSQVATGQGRRDGWQAPQVPGIPEATPPRAAHPDVGTSTGSAVGEANRSLAAAPVARDHLHPTRLGFEGSMGSTCTGTVAVGQRAWLNSPHKQPNVVAGQTIPAQAQFFRRSNGTPWVRFDAFGRPPLDLPVRFVRSGVTWTGEYGISYTVQAAGESRLVGLAALVANDSATLEFACMGSATQLF